MDEVGTMLWGRVTCDLRMGVQKLKDATPDGVLLGSGKLATELDRLDLIDEYQLLALTWRKVSNFSPIVVS
ncbi:hypothetical protein [Aquabacterium sp.]|uniref:hypothetical protein n=1 Tax=Aquabacterium sp. TaxID=1872578 RepID=UPI0025C0CACD|nr:hypothetical protein [Aquabacterium sp.]